MVLEAFLDDGQDLFVDEAADGVLDHALVVREQPADVVEIEWVQHGRQSTVRSRGLCRRSIRDAEPAIHVRDEPDRPYEEELYVLEERRPGAFYLVPDELTDPRDHEDAEAGGP